jgi:ATP-dependent Lon protease
MSDTPVISLPVLPLRDIVVFPHMIVPLFVGREKSIKALEAVMAEDKQIILVTQKKRHSKTRTHQVCMVRAPLAPFCNC